MKTERVKIRAVHDGTVGAARAERDQDPQAARALRDHRIAAEARQDFTATMSQTSTRIIQKLQAKREHAGSICGMDLEQFDARAGAELAKLLPEIDAVRAEKEVMARAATTNKRRSDSGAASAQQAAPERRPVVDRVRGVP